MKKTIKKIIPFGLLAIPFSVGAVSNVNDVFVLAESILGKLAPMLIAVAVVVLLVAILGYIKAGSDEDKKKTYKDLMIYGIISLFVMVSIWGLVAILSGTFNLDNDIPDIDILPGF